MTWLLILLVVLGLTGINIAISYLFIRIGMAREEQSE